MTGDYAPNFERNGGDASGRGPPIAGEETGANETQTAMDQSNIQQNSEENLGAVQQ